MVQVALAGVSPPEQEHSMSQLDALALARSLADVVYEKKAEHVTILDVSGRHSEIDYFVLATCRGARHAAVTGEEALHFVKRNAKGYPYHLEKGEEWICGDFGSVVVHVFTPQAREFYDLEHLWGDADRVDWQPTTESREISA
jgi:ribosome-associated protein